MSPGELYEKYRQESDNPVTKRTVRNYINKMDHYNLVESAGNRRGRTYRVN
ncbi:MAG: hypothetical protein SXQ77_12500 [Halobacteria archaeon]|nr:hypothetical protein [Halobacteria archaeon]